MIFDGFLLYLHSLDSIDDPAREILQERLTSLTRIGWINAHLIR